MAYDLQQSYRLFRHMTWIVISRKKLLSISKHLWKLDHNCHLLKNGAAMQRNNQNFIFLTEEFSEDQPSAKHIEEVLKCLYWNKFDIHESKRHSLKVMQKLHVLWKILNDVAFYSKGSSSENATYTAAGCTFYIECFSFGLVQFWT